MQFSDRFKSWRQAQAATQMQLAQVLNRSISTIQRWESGFGTASAADLDKLEKAFPGAWDALGPSDSEGSETDEGAA